MRRDTFILVPTLVVTFTCALTPLRTVAQCDAQWKGTHPFGISGSVHALASHDADGAGPGTSQLVVGGLFDKADDEIVSNIALWDGSKWSPIGDPDGANGQVNAILSFDPDEAGPSNPILVIGGAFTSVGGNPANHVAIWNGATWSAIPHGSGDGVDGVVNALTVFDDDDAGPNPPSLYIGGNFATGGGITANHVIKWDGTNWSALGSPEGVAAEVRALAVFDADDSGPGAPQLIVGGDFVTTGGGLTVNRIASWNGTSWSALSPGVNGKVYALEVLDMDGDGPGLPSLFAGGTFSASGLFTTGSVLRWDGAVWSALVAPGQPRPSKVYALAGFTPDGMGSSPTLYATGDFIDMGPTSADYIAKWDGLSWSEVSSEIENGMTGAGHALAVHDLDGGGPLSKTLVIGGDFDQAGNVVASGITQHNSEQFCAWPNPSGKLSGLVGPPSSGPEITVMGSYDDEGGNPFPELYVGGTFLSIGDAKSYNVAKWDGFNWVTISTDVPGDCIPYAMASIDVDGPGPGPRELVVGGFFTNLGGVNTPGIVKWDGSTWSALNGIPFNGGTNTVTALAAFDEEGAGPGNEKLFIYGLGGGIQRWDGAGLTPIGSLAGASPLRVNCMITWDDDGPGPNPEALYVGGKFDSVGGVLAGGIAKWDGTNWSGLFGPLGLGVTGEVMSLAVHDEDGAGPALPKLFVGGLFAQAGGVTVNNVARWDGSAWSALAGSNGTGVNDFVRAMASLDDDGPGLNPPSLLMGGAMSMAGSVPSFRACRWDGQRWWALDEPFGNGTPGPNGILQGCLIAHDDDGPGPRPMAVFAGGAFNSAGGLEAARIAKWGREYALGDGNFDGVFDGSEIQMFVDVLLAPPAVAPSLCIYDFDKDGEVTAADVPYFASLLLDS